MEIYALYPRYDARQSFYNKAIVRVCRTKKILYSYNTKVATIKGDKIFLNRKIDESLLFSQTTLRHIKEFIAQELGVFDLTKSDLKEWCY